MTVTFDRTITNDFEASGRLEWIEANGLGGGAGSTVSGAHSRRHHGLLVAATSPPAGRMVLLSKLDESVIDAGTRHDFGANLYPGAIHPSGYRNLARFERDLFPVFEYEAGGVKIRKTVAAIHGENTTVVAYEVLEAPGPFTFELRPFVACRDQNALAHANPYLNAAGVFDSGVLRLKPYDGAPDVFVAVPRATFLAAGDWYRNFEYAADRESGLECHEDLFTPGVFVRETRPGDRFVVIASVADPAGRDGARLLDGERRRRETLVAGLPEEGDTVRRALVLAADQFVARREDGSTAILAGDPWSAEWSRDAMIALAGIALGTGRTAEAIGAIRIAASRLDEGILPRRVPEAGEASERDTVDAPLWIFVAVHEYLAAGGDERSILDEILPALESIVDRYEAGTLYGIRVDEDGLLRAGDPGTCLTWMDARVGGRPVTSRHGKPVEVNALWHNALCVLADLLGRAGRSAEAREASAKAQRVKKRFAETFWNAESGYLFDVVDADRRDGSIRPNAVIALSLPHAVLGREPSRSVLRVAEEKLLTPCGLRSLAPGEPDYRPSLVGGLTERAASLHQGTVWSWLIGPYATALVRAHGAPGKTKARRLLEEIGPQLLTQAAVGTIPEGFDGDAPHRPRGWAARAWSVAELLRAWTAVVPTTRAEKDGKAAGARKRSYRIVPVEPKSAAVTVSRAARSRKAPDTGH